MQYRLLFAILATAFLEQTVITIVRITTSYWAVESNLSVVWVGVITAVYALLPIGYPLGRFGPVGRKPLEDAVYRDRWGEPF